MEENAVVLPFGAMTFTFRGWVVESGEVFAFPTRAARRVYREKYYILMSKEGAVVSPYVDLDRGRMSKQASIQIPASDLGKILRCQKCNLFSLQPSCSCGAPTKQADYDPFMALRAGNQHIYARPYVWSAHRHKIREFLASGELYAPGFEYLLITEEGKMLPSETPTPPRGYYILAKREELMRLASFREKDRVWGLCDAIDSMIRSVGFWMAV